ARNHEREDSGLRAGLRIPVGARDMLGRLVPLENKDRWRPASFGEIMYIFGVLTSSKNRM
ncbi:MAG TPA: hypothetical protein VGX70_01000, partial [Gemmataceae bacterium]|nr:hypothetical protein [Gemmataceae bacterium]